MEDYRALCNRALGGGLVAITDWSHASDLVPQSCHANTGSETICPLNAPYLNQIQGVEETRCKNTFVLCSRQPHQLPPMAHPACGCKPSAKLAEARAGQLQGGKIQPDATRHGRLSRFPPHDPLRIAPASPRPKFHMAFDRHPPTPSPFFPFSVCDSHPSPVPPVSLPQTTVSSLRLGCFA